jgi:hypothetical protein
MRQWRALALFACVAWLLPAAAADLDVNRDGMIRIALLSVPVQGGGIRSDRICEDLESMIKASKPGKPVRVVLEPLTKTRTLFGWWYHPEERASRSQLASGRYDSVLLAESDEIVRGYPELFFEGVRVVKEGLRAKGVPVALVLLAKPVETFRDKRVNALADIVYRVGDGCGVKVIPAALGWVEALTHNWVTGDSPIKVRANAFLAAAGIYCELTDERVPKAALETDWTTKKTADVLASSARDAVRQARLERHYSGPFNGIVRIDARIKKRLKMYVPNTSVEDPVRANFQFILDAAFQDCFWKTPADWYEKGFDRYASAFDLVYGDTRQMDLFLDGDNFTSVGQPLTNSPQPCVAVFCRNPEGDAEGQDALRSLESVLIEGYDYAKGKGLVFVPYQIAWARVWLANPSLIHKSVPGRSNDWLSYMLANMIYTMVTDRYQPVPEREKPHTVNPDHPHGYHELCARIGYDTMRQLSRLSMSENAVMMRTETYRIDAANPGFVALRLLDQPSSDVRVFCATDVPGVAQLSSEELIFTPGNFDIEQSVRVLPATNSPTLFFHFMAGARSEDKAIDGANDVRPFLLNYDESEKVSFDFDRKVVSPRLGFQVVLVPSRRPSDMVCASILQHGQMTEEVYFSHDYFSGHRIRLYPSSEDYEKGMMQVTIRTTSSDRRFNGNSVDQVVRVSSDGETVPSVRVTSPAEGSVLAGPAFVTAQAEASSNDVSEVSIFLGQKRLGKAASSVCSVMVEQGPPQSRLGVGDYALWAVANTTKGVVVSSDPITFRVREEPSAALNATVTAY